VAVHELVAQVSEFFGLPPAQAEEMLELYRAFHEARGYARTLGERKTLCFEEAFVLYVLLALRRPRTLVEIGTLHGASLRRLLDIKRLLGLDARVLAFDVADQVRHFTPEEATLRLQDLTGRFTEEVLQAHEPGLIFNDAHTYALLREVIATTAAAGGQWCLAVHDCGPGLCNPHMTLAKDDPNVTSLTGVWERHVLAEVFSVADPLSERLDGLETASHRWRIFTTPHGLGVLVPR
jgi:hypothetical protein